ncbi:conserved hypothetical protein [Microsporum canis CBS 113480]|uniref:Telomere length regulation protein conserved domain-containing protein n=1 Tax=Arthroderma otae (strain ATCC MYA-4605 / CBS 113480) TaxID=554155 RepID=C5FSZ5_ARTOC|nr:conserved hypothetical protein [Microsporum canis CBS 113480]EEQ32998.1 conserved hypothetical protein [Microsporum canis CBS 113480]
MEGLLKVVKTSDNLEDSLAADSALRESSSLPRISIIEEPQPETKISSPEDVLQLLKSKAPTSAVLEALRFLDPAGLEDGDFNIIIPSSLGAQILHALITTTIHDHWASLGMEYSLEKSYQADTKRRPQSILLRCLKSASGIGTLLAHIRSLLPSQNLLQGKKTTSDKGTLIQDTISILSCLLSPSHLLFQLFTDMNQLIDNTVQRQLLWREIISLLASGKVLSIAAESLKYTESSTEFPPTAWISNGKLYGSWLGRNIGYMVSQLQLDDSEAWKELAAFTSRSLSIGHPERDEGSNVDTAISNISAILSVITRNASTLKDFLKSWLISGTGGSITSIQMRRSLLAAFSCDTESLYQIFTKSIDLFGDKLSIKHSPIQAQEANAQVILLTSGYLHRHEESDLFNLLQSSSYLSAISNRLGAASTRCRFLGMVVGTSLSKLTDKPENYLKFDLAEMNSEEALWYLRLSDIQDRVGSMQELRNTRTLPHSRTTKKRNSSIKQKKRQEPNTEPVTPKLSPLPESDESEEDNLTPYQKPDADASDSDEDPTLIQRSKPNPPVYIRDLLMYLRDVDNYDRYSLGISTAPSLIRRKIAFGSELDEHIRDLALTLIGLHDKYNTPKFQEYRLQSLVTLITARPLVLGPWAANAFFNIDLSQSQRSSLLISLGLAARELAGYREEDNMAMSLPASADTSFPSQRLPPQLESKYGSTSETNPIEAISKTITRTSLEPLALNAADTLSGPNALKVRKFSSRMEVEKKKHEREQLRRARSIPKDLHKTLFEAFFRPLTGGFGLMLYSMSSYNGNNPFFVPHLLSLFMQTINLVVSTIGPSSANQLTITSDAFTLLISLHNSPVATEPTVLSAILSLFLTVLDINIASGTSGEEQLVTEFAEQVMELREWVSGIFEKTPKGDDQIRMLAAGIMVKLSEIMNRYQNRLFGINAEFSF